MRTTFFIYAILALIDALLIWQLGGGPVVVSVTFTGIVLYAGGREILGSRFDVLRAGVPVLVFVTAILTRKGSGEISLFLGVLASLHVYIAESCAHHAAWVKTHGKGIVPKMEIRMFSYSFSYAFYVSLWPAYLLLSGRVFGLPEWQAVLAAAVVVVLSFLGWEFGRVIDLRQGHVRKKSTVLDRLAGLSLGTACFAFLLLLFTYAVPGLTAGISLAAKDLKANLGIEEAKKIGNPGGRQQVGMSKMDRHELPLRMDLDDTRRNVDLYVQLVDSAAAELLREQTVYVRTAVHDRFNGSRWMASEEINEWIEDTNKDGRTIVNSQENLIPAPAFDHVVYVMSDGGNDLPAIQGVTSFNLDRVSLHANDWFQVNRKKNIAYHARSVPRSFEDVVASGGPINAGGGLDPDYTKIEASDSVWDLRDIAETVSSPGSPLVERMQALRSYIQRKYSYSLKVENPDGVDPILNFLRYEKKGNCDYFATVGTLMVRVLGIPSRMAYGYSGGDYEPNRHIFTFYNNNAHAWTEVYLQGHGWVVFDFTPSGDGNRSPARAVEIPDKELDEKKFEMKDGQGNEEKQENEEGKSPGTTEEGQEGEDKKEDQSDAETSPSALETLEDSPLKTELLISIVAGALGLFVLLLGILWLLRRKRGEQAGKEGSDKEDAPPPGYVTDLFQLCTRVGYPREEGETLREIESGLSNVGVLESGNELKPMLKYHYLVRYEGGTRETERESGFRKLIRALGAQWIGGKTGVQ